MPTNTWNLTNAQSNHSIHAVFGPASFTVTATATAGGDISPSGGVVVAYGSNITFNITTNFEFGISDIEVDSTPQGTTNDIWTFTNVTSDHTIHAIFGSLGTVITTNGTPSDWLDVFGLMDYEQDDVSDPDGDGMATYLEYRAGTDPTNNADRVEMSFSIVDGKFIVTFQGILATGPGYTDADKDDRLYLLEYCTNLAIYTWYPVPSYTNVLGQDQPISSTNALLPRKFFRLKAWLE